MKELSKILLRIAVSVVLIVDVGYNFYLQYQNNQLKQEIKTLKQK